MSFAKVDVIVVGVGTMGAAAAYHLARRGASVLGLEQHAIPHTLGAHHGFSRAIRSAYYEHPNYVPLLKRSFALWDALERTSGQRVLYRTGGLYMGPEDAAFITGATRAATAHQLPYERLSPAQLRERFPQFELPSHYTGFLEAEAGFVVPEIAMNAHVEGALRGGATLLGHVKVTSWQVTSEGVRIETNRGAFRAKHVVLTAGAWAPLWSAGLPFALKVTRQTWGWFWPKVLAPFALGTLPTWFIESEPASGYYGFPMMPEQPGLKLALHQPGTETTAESVDRRIDLAGDEAPLRRCLEGHLPEGNGHLLALRTCLYTNSPDGHFIIDRHPTSANVTIACGFSGHGFKFAPVVGEILADLALLGRTDHPIDFLSMDRFR